MFLIVSIIEIVKRLMQSKNLPLQVLFLASRMPARLEIPDKEETVSIEPGLAALKAYARQGDMLVVPVATVQRLIGSGALEFGAAGRIITLVIAASPSG
jgi:hypothetical protein